MPLETGTTIASLNSANPLIGDIISQGDDHIRLIKAVLKATFPGAAAAGFTIPITATEAQLNFVTGVTSSIQTQLNNKAAIGANTDITSLNSPNINSATAVTQAALDSTTKVATTAFVTTADSLKAPIANPTFTGVPAAPTAAIGTNTTQLATTAFVNAEAVGIAGIDTITGVKTFQAGAEPIALNICKAWCNFDGTLAGTNAPRKGFNVSNITRTGVGAYTVNFANAMADKNYCLIVTTSSDGASVTSVYESGTYTTARSSGSFNIQCGTNAGAAADRTSVSIMVLD
jgi:hypothetical protein